MKKIYLLFVMMIAAAGTVSAQQQYELTQFFQNPQALNPAFTGIEKYWQTNVGYRKLWAGSDYAPQQGFISLNGSFYKPDLRLNSIRISRPEAYEENLSNKEYRRLNARHGLGLYYGYIGNSVTTDDQGQLTYAYHMPLTRKLNVSAGAGVAYLTTYLTPGGYKVRQQQDLIYQDLMQTGVRKRQATINTGLSMYGNNFYVGYSTTRMAFLKGTTDELHQDQVNYIEHTINAGYQLPLSHSLRLQPGLLIQYDRLMQAAVYGNVKVRYNELLWAGISYRNKEAYGLMMGFLLSDHLSMGYAYEQNIYEFDAAHNGNHELVLGYRFFRKGYKATSYFW
jgi:type IX secretion system PorP/SprF family membrane protein